MSTCPVLSYRPVPYLALCVTPLRPPLVVHAPYAYLSPFKGSLTPLTWTTGACGEIPDPRTASPLIGFRVGSLAPFSVNTNAPWSASSDASVHTTFLPYRSFSSFPPQLDLRSLAKTFCTQCRGLLPSLDHTARWYVCCESAH